MPKPHFQDIVPPERRSIKRIPLPERSRRTNQYEELPPEPKPTGSGRSIRILFTLFVLAIIIGTAFWFVSRVSDADVTIVPKTQPISVDATLTAQKEGGDLQFQTITIAKDGKMTIQATGQEYVQLKAQGIIIVYNTTNTPQKLVANTRFQTPEGLIFRILTPITVPAQSGSTPGSVEAAITADAPGAQYNVGLKDLTIPGFKGDPRYTKVYARTKLPIQGGFVGTRSTVDPIILADARSKIHDELQAALVQEAQKDIPSGFVLPANSYFIEYESLPLIDATSGNGTTVTERATFHGIIFDRTLLANALATKVNGIKETNPTDISHIDNLIFTAKAATSTASASSTSPWDNSSLTFSIKGTTTLISVINPDVLKDDLAGKPRKNLNAILEGYGTIAKAEVTMRPFWRSTFPTNKDDIHIIVANP